MRLLVFSYKVCWPDADSVTGFVTYGGFPQQIEIISGLFSETRLVILEREGSPPAGVIPVTGHQVTVLAKPEPKGRGVRRKAGSFWWLIKYAPVIRRELRAANAVHAVVPGDIGFIGLILSVLFGKPLFVRHCGTWGHSVTVADRLLMWILRRIAGGRRVVMATGGGDELPEPCNPAITWIFSTSLREGEHEDLRRTRYWDGGPLRIVTVGRLDRGKNTIACVEALPGILKNLPGSTLDIVGDGPERRRLEQRIAELGLDEAIVFHGNLTHEGVLEVLKRGDLFLFPTRVAEGFPKAVLEAMAAGLPVIAPRVSVLPHLIGGRCGVLLEGTDPGDVVRAVLECTRDLSVFREISEAAQETSREYTLEGWAGLIRARLEGAWGSALREVRGEDHATRSAEGR